MVIGDLAVLAYARGFTHWLYRDETALASPLRAGFFSRAAAMMATGDLITITAPSGTAIRTVIVTPESLDERGAHIPARVDLVRVH